MPKPANKIEPDFSLENQYDACVFGFDEVGRGPLAGPVTAACVHIPKDRRALEFIAHIRDSKTLSKTKLKELAALIEEHFICSIGECSPAEIDQLNVLQASLTAMERAFETLPKRYKSNAYALIDGKFTPKNLPCPAEAVIKGDQKSKSIAAAAIVAKVHRDSYMQKIAQEHPQYGWERNAAYPTREHLDAIETHGITKYHRKSFAPVKKLILKDCS